MFQQLISIDNLKFDEKGLIPVIVQDHQSGQVLMMAYMNKEALMRTLSSGEAHYWSRSRQTLWHKGETSGNYQHLIAMQVDCDLDCLLMQVKTDGPACHTGHQSCFYRQFPMQIDSENNGAKDEHR